MCSVESGINVHPCFRGQNETSSRQHIDRQTCLCQGAAPDPILETDYNRRFLDVRLKSLQAIYEPSWKSVRSPGRDEIWQQIGPVPGAAPRNAGTLGGLTIMRLNAFTQTFVPVVFGLGFVVFGIVAFIRVGNSQQQLEARLQSIRAGKTQPETLTVVGKYVNHGGKVNYPYIAFSSSREPKVNLAVTVDIFNRLKLGDTIDGYYFPDGYFIPQNHGRDAGAGKWFFLSLGVLLGAAVLALAFAMARRKPPAVDIDALRTIFRDRMDEH